MAASACTTLVPVAASRSLAHPAAISVAIAYAVMQSTDIPNQVGRGCLLLEDGPVFFDAGRMPEPGGQAVVVDRDGRLVVRAVYPVAPTSYRPLGEAMVKVLETGPHSHGILEVGWYVTLVGAVAKG